MGVVPGPGAEVPAAALLGAGRAGARRADALERHRRRTGSTTPSCSRGRAASARPAPPASWPRRSSCEKGPTAEPCGVCDLCQEIAGGRSVDVIEIDAASNTKVEETKSVLEGVRYLPARARRKVYIIDEVHMLSAHSFNALLKTLEEPPPHVVFVFATTEVHKIPVTILSRCQRFDFKLISTARLTDHLDRDPARREDRRRARGGPSGRPAGGRLGARRAVAARPGDRLRRDRAADRRGDGRRAGDRRSPAAGGAGRGGARSRPGGGAAPDRAGRRSGRRPRGSSGGRSSASCAISRWSPR